MALGRLVNKGEVYPPELVEAAVTVIDRLNPRLNAVIHKLYDMGAAAAKTVDRTRPSPACPFCSRNWLALAGRSGHQFLAST